MDIYIKPTTSNEHSFLQLIANTRAGNAHSKQGATTRQALVTAHEHVIFVRRNAHLLNLTFALLSTLQATGQQSRAQET